MSALAFAASLADAGRDGSADAAEAEGVSAGLREAAGWELLQAASKNADMIRATYFMLSSPFSQADRIVQAGSRGRD